MNIVSIILDAAFVVTVLVMIRSAYRRGFLQSVVQTIGYIAASILAFWGSRVLSEAVYQLFFRDSLRGKLEEALIAASDSGDLAERLQKVAETLPQFLQNLLSSSGMGPDALAEQLHGSVEESAAQLSNVILETAIHPLLTMLLQGICFLILFSAAMVLVRCLVKLLRGVRHIPLVGTLNAVLGGVMGLIQAAVVWFVVAVAIDFIIALTGGFDWLNAQTVQEGFIFRHFYALVRSVFSSFTEI